MEISIIGLGLIGGSLALDLAARGHQVIGADRNDRHCDRAVALDIVRECLPMDEAVDRSSVVILAVPVDQIEMILPDLLNRVKNRQVVLDVGSTKRRICAAIEEHPFRGRFVAAHPLAGTEFSGPDAALPALFAGKKNIICEADRSDSDALEKVVTLFNSIGMTSFFMAADDHDRHMAYVSHLSHISAFALSLAVLDIEKDEKQIVNLAGTGFESTVRLAKSAPDTWASIFAQNADYLSEAIERHMHYLARLKQCIDDGHTGRLHETLATANDIQRVLNGLALNVVKLS